MAFEKINYPFKTQTVLLTGGENLAYIFEGAPNNPPLILLHGLGSNCLAWKKNVPYLSEALFTIAPDLPGYGKSTKNTKFSGSMSDFAETIIRFLDALELSEAHFCGHSMGGQIAITLALKYPQRVKSLTLLAPAGFETFTAQEAEIIRRFYTEEMVRNVTEEQIESAVKLNFFRFSEEARYMIEDRIAIKTAPEYDTYGKIVVRALNGMLDAPIFEELSELKPPTLVFFGENDALIPSPFSQAKRSAIEIACAGAEQIPNGRLETLQECGHFVPFEASERINEKILAFIQANH